MRVPSPTGRLHLGQIGAIGNCTIFRVESLVRGMRVEPVIPRFRVRLESLFRRFGFVQTMFPEATRRCVCAA